MDEGDRLKEFLDLDPSRVAIVLVDFQKDFCQPGSFGADPTNTAANAETAARADAFAQAAHDVGVTTVYTREVLDLGRLDERQRHWERDSPVCRVGSPGAELFVEPVAGSFVVEKLRFDIWQSIQFTRALDDLAIDGLVIGGVELQCCVLYAALGARERGYHYVVPQDLVSGLNSRDATSNRAARDLLRFGHPSPQSSTVLLDAWKRTSA